MTRGHADVGQRMRCVVREQQNKWSFFPWSVEILIVFQQLRVLTSKEQIVSYITTCSIQMLTSVALIHHENLWGVEV
jgi:hypothetical protein